MKHYVIDELRPQDVDQLKKYLDAQLESSGVTGLYWVQLKDDLLSNLQMTHTECQPFYFAVALESDHLSCELLIRTRRKMTCDCIAYATQIQRDWIINWADHLFDELGLYS